MLTVIIPAKNEIYLQKTIENVLENAVGEIEIIAICDGYWPDPPINDHPSVRIIHNTVSRGQRQSINDAARIAQGKYIMKLDAHCAVSKGFDEILARDCQYEWTMIPRMYNLDIETWEPKLHKRTDYMYIGMVDGNLRAQYYQGGHRQPRNDLMIDETMCCMGPGFFMHKDRFWELGGCDENHGHWGQQGVEVACKAWLSGGALMVNKNCWFAHWFRGHVEHTEGPGAGRKGFPYEISKRQTDAARKYSDDLWLNDKWPLAKRKLQWLVDKFNPPTWGKKKLQARRQRSHITDKIFDVNELLDNYNGICIPNKKDRLVWFKESFIDFLNNEDTGKFQDLEYFKYLTSRRRNKTERALNIMQLDFDQFKDIKDNGLKYPLDFYVEDGNYILLRGYRRLFMLAKLGYTEIPARVFKSKEYFEKLTPPTHPNGPLQNIACRHFQQKLHKSTDKYWLHNYLPYYEQHINEPKSILEIGAFYGASLDLWKEAFPEAKIFGLDKTDRNLEHQIFIGSQDDPELAKEVSKVGPFDLIIDDASHFPDHTFRTFNLYWPMCTKWYVIEDLYSNYRNGRCSGSMMRHVHKLIDEMNLKCEIKSIHTYYNIVFIEKT